MRILKTGYYGYPDVAYFEEHYYSFLNDLSSENQQKVENITPRDWAGEEWENAYELLAELWFQEHPNTMLVWISDLPNDVFGDTVLRVDLSDMESFLDDYSYGSAYKYELKGGEKAIPAKFFSLYEEPEDELV
jgi:hypothetical protein